MTKKEKEKKTEQKEKRTLSFPKVYNWIVSGDVSECNEEFNLPSRGRG